MDDLLNLVPRYKRRRSAGKAVNHALVERLSKDVLDEGAKKLGILQGKTLVLDSEDELAILMDFCIHDVRRNGRTAVESFFPHAPYPPDSEEMAYLTTLKQAQYSVFLIERVERGCGIEVRDLWRDGTKFIMDVSFGNTASPRMVLATRLVPFESVFTTTGAPLPLGVLPNTWAASPLQGLLEKMKGVDGTGRSAEQISESVATLLRTFLKAGAGENVRYANPDELPSPRRRPSSPAPSGHVGRNDPCPCGSGKKFKKCCGLGK